MQPRHAHGQRSGRRRRHHRHRRDAHPARGHRCAGGRRRPASASGSARGRAAPRRQRRSPAWSTDSAVSCEPRGLDKYGRTLAVCFVDGRDINAQMVRQGYAWAFVKYSTSYVKEEARRAKAEGLGIWQGESQPAWEYRARRWAAAEEQAPEGCAIKGNITKQRQDLPHALEPLVRADQDRARQGQALVLHARPRRLPRAGDRCRRTEGSHSSPFATTVEISSNSNHGNIYLPSAGQGRRSIGTEGAAERAGRGMPTS